MNGNFLPKTKKNSSETSGASGAERRTSGRHSLAEATERLEALPHLHRLQPSPSLPFGSI